MKRLEVYAQIDSRLQTCRTCETREELNRIHGGTFSKIDGYCNKNCPIGQELQALGKQLITGRKTKIPTWWDREYDIMADYLIIPGEAG